MYFWHPSLPRQQTLWRPAAQLLLSLIMPDAEIRKWFLMSSLFKNQLTAMLAEPGLWFAATVSLKAFILIVKWEMITWSWGLWKPSQLGPQSCYINIWRLFFVYLLFIILACRCVLLECNAVYLQWLIRQPRRKSFECRRRALLSLSHKDWIPIAK